MYDDSNEFNELDENKKTILVNWCKNKLTKIKSFNEKITSYGLKHYFESDENGFYITNGQFKGAMEEAGFIVLNKFKTNWIFNISNKSINNLFIKK